MSDANVLKEFVVELGWKSDATQQRRVTDAIASVTKGIGVMATAITAAEVALVGIAQRVARSFEALAYASSRVNASAKNIATFRYAISQLGGTAEGAMASLEAFARKLRESPGQEAMLKGWGVRTRDASGKLRDSTELMKEFLHSRKFLAMPEFTRLQLAESMGIDERTYRAMLGDVERFTAEYQAKMRKAGLDPDAAAENAKKFQQAWRSMLSSIEVIVDRIATTHGERIAKLLDKFTAFVDKHGDRIARGFESIIALILRAADAIGRFVGSFVEFISQADPVVKKLTGIEGAFEAIAIVLLARLIPGVSTLTALLTGLVGGPAWRSFVAVLSALGMGGAALAMGGAALGFGAGMMPGSAGAGENEFERQEKLKRDPDYYKRQQQGGGSLWERGKRWWGDNAPAWAGGDRASKSSAVPHDAKSFTGALGVSQKEYEAMREGVAGLEGSRYNQMGGSSGRFAGRYQMGAAEIRETAARLGVPAPTRQQFLSDPEMQERFFEAYTLGHHEWLSERSSQYRAMSAREKMKVLGYAHNQGAGGALNWIRTGRAGRDAFGTSGSAYAAAIARRFGRMDATQSNAGGFIGSANAAPVSAGPMGGGNSFVHNIAHGHSIHAKTTINVNAAGDPGATARAVAGMQKRVHADTIRNMQGAAH